MYIKKNGFKRMVTCGISLGMTALMLANGLTGVKAQAYHHVIYSHETNAYDLADNFKKNSKLCDKLKLDYEKSVTSLKDSLEKEMNAMGVFDSDIAALDESTIEDINNAAAYSVKVMYYEEDLETSTLTEMAPSDVDELIGNVYEMELEEESIFEKIWNATIFGSVKASAKTTSDTTTSASGKMKQIIWCTQSSVNSDVKVTYSSMWLQRPVHTRTDIAGVSLKNATPKKNTWTAYHRCEYRGSVNNPYTTYEEKVNYKSANVDGMAAQFTLFSESLVDIQEERFIMEFYCTIDNKKSQDTIVATGQYYHCKVEKNYSLGISIGEGGLSLSLSTSWSSVYDCISQNPMVSFRFLK